MGAASFRPQVGRIVVAVPFQSPQLFESQSSDRKIQKDAVHRCAMPVETETPHVIVLLRRCFAMREIGSMSDIVVKSGSQCNSKNAQTMPIVILEAVFC